MCGARMINRKVLLIIIPVTLLALLLASCASNAEQPPPPDEPYPAPMLISPVIGAVMDNGRTDGKDSIIWEFDWSDVPGATQYQLYVDNPDVISGFTLYLNRITTSSYYHQISPGSYIGGGDQYYHGWMWKVRAKISGQELWNKWSEVRTFNIEPVDTDLPQNSFTTEPRVSPSAPNVLSHAAPTLISPVNKSVMDNGRTDGKDSIIWDFDWLDVPGATQYRLRVFNSVAIPGLVLDLNGATTTSSSYHHVSPSSYIGEQYYHGWTWTVMAKVGGQWSDWSEMRTFNVEPVN